MEKIEREPRNHYVRPTVITYGDVAQLTRASVGDWHPDALGWLPPNS